MTFHCIGRNINNILISPNDYTNLILINENYFNCWIFKDNLLEPINNDSEISLNKNEY